MKHLSFDCLTVFFFLTIFGSLAYGQAPNNPTKSKKAVSLQAVKLSGGTIEGTVIYHADPKRRWRYARYYVQSSRKGYLAEALVCLRSRKLKKQSPPARPTTVVIDQKDHNFTPETTAIRVGDRVKFTNSDYQVHNVYSTDSRNVFDITMGSEGSFIQPFDRASGINRPVKVGCRFHGSMRAWVYVLEHPYFQVTSIKGQFRLENVPPGDYYLEMRHPAGELSWRRKIKVSADQKQRIDINVSPDNLLE